MLRALTNKRILKQNNSNLENKNLTNIGEKQVCDLKNLRNNTAGTATVMLLSYQLKLGKYALRKNTFVQNKHPNS